MDKAEKIVILNKWHTIKLIYQVTGLKLKNRNSLVHDIFYELPVITQIIKV